MQLARQLEEALLSEKSERGDVVNRGYTLNIAKVSLEDARAHVSEALAKVGKTIDSVLPSFDENYGRIQGRLKKARNIPRVKMPVINSKDAIEFQRAIASGRIDIFEPWAKGKLYAPGNRLADNERGEWLSLGFKDGKVTDDRIDARITKLSAGRLLPTQNQIWLDSITNALVKYGPATDANPLSQYTIIVSEEGYLLDGHHRWALAMLTDPAFQLHAVHVPLGLETLLKVGQTYGAAIGNKPNV